jgi:uncharacterized membrane protein YdbT with pleckstrin-like domain
VRDGYLFRRWRATQFNRLQALALRRSSLDRLFGTSTLQLDIPSHQTFAQAFSIRYLPEIDAFHLSHNIGGSLSKKKSRR